MIINSRQKGARGERLWRDELRANGFQAWRGQQFSGGKDSPDVVCPPLAGLHQEIKCVEKLNLDAACAQAERDGAGKPWIVAHKRNFKGWRVTMPSHLFFALIRGDALREISRRATAPESSANPAEAEEHADCSQPVAGSAGKTNL